MVSCTQIKAMAMCFVAALLCQQGQSFQGARFVNSQHSCSKSPSYPLRSLHARRRSLENGGDETGESTGIPQLPAFGASSFSNASTEDPTGHSQSPNADSADAAFVRAKFKLSYTCNVCDTRNSHMVSRMGK
jgi:hypothetical protein